MRHKLSEYIGIDVSIEISLLEYGFAWVETDKEFHFLYGIKVDEAGEYIRFDCGYFSKSTDISKEFSWADDYLKIKDIEESGWFNLSLPYQIYDLYNWYGYENVFGSSYWEGLTLDDLKKYNGEKS